MYSNRQVLGFEEAKQIKERLKFITDLPVKQGHIKMKKIIIVPANNDEFEIFWKNFTNNGLNEDSAIEPFKNRPLAFLLINNEGETHTQYTLSEYIKLNSLNIDLDEYFE